MLNDFDSWVLGLNVNAVLGREVGVTTAKTWKSYMNQDDFTNKTHKEIPPDVDRS